MNTDAKLGLTQMYVRLASRYLRRGVGSYDCDAFGYDTAKVSVDQSWNNYALEGDPPAYFMVMRVAFYTQGQRKKWIEFKSTMIGGGSREPGFRVVDVEGDE